MDSILNSLLSFGIGGFMAASVLWFLHHIVTKVLPAIIDSYQKALKEERDAHVKVSGDIVNKVEGMNTNITNLASKVDVVETHIRANHEHVSTLREYVMKKLPREN